MCLPALSQNGHVIRSAYQICIPRVAAISPRSNNHKKSLDCFHCKLIYKNRPESMLVSTVIPSSLC